MDYSLILAFCAIGFAIYNFSGKYDNKRKLLSKIPGPSIWPIIGNLKFFDRSSKPWDITYRLAERYGPVMSIKSGENMIVFLNSYEAIYEALVVKSKKFNNRPNPNRWGLLQTDRKGVIFSESTDQWKTLRRAFLLNFKYYGSGKSHLEPTILNLLEELKENIRKIEGKAFNPRPIFYRYFSSVVYVLNFGKKPSEDCFKSLEVYDRGLSKYLDPYGHGVEIDAFTWYHKWGLGGEPRRKLKEVEKHSMNLWQTLGKETERDPDTPAFQWEEGRIHDPCFAATLQAIIEANKDNGFDDFHAQGTLADTFIGGTGTSTSSLHFMFIILLHYPEVQDKMHEEIDRVLGGNNEANMSTDMKAEMPYLQATLYELLRYTTIAPFGFARKVEQDVDIQGYTLPKGTTVLPHLWYMHHDPDFWDEPFKFDPERFLDDEGKFVTAEHPNRRHWMPFGAGSRVCAGMVLALNRYFLTIGSILRHFRVERDLDVELQTCEPKDGMPGFIIHGQEYTARFIERDI